MTGRSVTLHLEEKKDSGQETSPENVIAAFQRLACARIRPADRTSAHGEDLRGTVMARMQLIAALMGPNGATYTAPGTKMPQLKPEAWILVMAFLFVADRYLETDHAKQVLLAHPEAGEKLMDADVQIRLRRNLLLLSSDELLAPFINGIGDSLINALSHTLPPPDEWTPELCRLLSDYVISSGIRPGKRSMTLLARILTGWRRPARSRIRKGLIQRYSSLNLTVSSLTWPHVEVIHEAPDRKLAESEALESLLTQGMIFWPMLSVNNRVDFLKQFAVLFSEVYLPLEPNVSARDFTIKERMGGCGHFSSEGVVFEKEWLEKADFMDAVVAASHELCHAVQESPAAIAKKGLLEPEIYDWFFDKMETNDRFYVSPPISKSLYRSQVKEAHAYWYQGNFRYIADAAVRRGLEKEENREHLAAAFKIAARETLTLGEICGSKKEESLQRLRTMIDTPPEKMTSAIITKTAAAGREILKSCHKELHLTFLERLPVWVQIDRLHKTFKYYTKLNKRIPIEATP